MALIFNRVERGRYLDSVALMRVSRELEALPGVEAAALMIGTPSNKALMREAGLLAPEGEQAGANDLVVALRASDEAAAAAAARNAEEMLARKEAAGAQALPHARSLAGALERLPGANLAVVSVPGAFAALEARKCLERGLHVLVFSDNVSLEDEAALKRLAAGKGLLLMGPDCGTAIIAGTPIAFANAVPRGDIGIVSASGTGLQEVSSLIAHLGGGVSHGIGVGGRDLDARVGALGTLAALDALERDAGTQKIVLISKPPAPDVARVVLARVKRSAKPCIVCFLGSSEAGLARTLREAAELAVGRRITFKPEKKLPHVKGRVQGLFCGGTLCAEADVVLARTRRQLVDLGDDRYTRGRPHPMIEPALRNEHVAAAVADPEVGVILVDVVLGYGSHHNPAGLLVESLNGKKPVVASVTGTEEDPQRWSRQVAILHAAGVLVAPSNAHAAELAASLVS